jgi:hypothetical protein
MDTLDTRCVAVFTARSPQRIVREGGSQAWSLDAARVRTLPFVVCIQNQNNPDRDFSDASEGHGSAFLVGRISDVVPSPEDLTSGRWMIQISEYSIIRNPKNVWQGWRNPVKYGSLEDFDIDGSKLAFHSVAEIQRDMGVPPQQPTPPLADDGGSSPISIATAKRGLSTFYGVPPDAIEIVIRG